MVRRAPLGEGLPMHLHPHTDERFCIGEGEHDIRLARPSGRSPDPARSLRAARRATRSSVTTRPTASRSTSSDLVAAANTPATRRSENAASARPPPAAATTPLDE
jgi:hypothetical protein